jgi:hypothetical protein
VEHRQHILHYLGFQRFDEAVQGQLETWLMQQVQLGKLPEELFPQAAHYVLDRRILLPGPSVLERLIIPICSAVPGQLFESMFQRLAPELRQAIDQLLTVPEGEQRSAFSYLKEYPPAATIDSQKKIREAEGRGEWPGQGLRDTAVLSEHPLHMVLRRRSPSCPFPYT